MSAPPSENKASHNHPLPVSLKDTLTLPKTDFPMKANLPQNEPKRLAAWKEAELYKQIRKARKDSPKGQYILHDGPPYANGAIHLGHALNKVLKDFVVKSKTMAGFDAPYVPGWDCHGLPIEIKVDEQLGRKKLEMPALSVRRACREYAQKYVDLQSDQFQRLAVFGQFGRPYLTMSKEYEAKIVETFFEFFEQGFVYKGLKPVYWCINDRTALAEAEVEYEMHTSPSVYVRYALKSDPAAIDQALAGKSVNTIIWTTTPWTLPASLAVAFHPQLDYVALEQDGQVYIVAEALASATREACKLEQAIEVARFEGSKLDRVVFQHPFLDREILGVNADYVTTDQGTGAVHTAPSHGADDFYTGGRYGLDQTCKVDDAGRIHADPDKDGLPEYDGLRVFDANAPIIELLKTRGALMGRSDIYHSYPHCWRCHKPIIFRATEQWFIAMDTPMKRSEDNVILSEADLNRERSEGEGGAQSKDLHAPIANSASQEITFRQYALAEIDKVKWDPAWGKERISNMVQSRPDWCISRQRIWGVPIAVFSCKKCSKIVENHDLNAQIVALFEREGADGWYTEAADQLIPKGTTCAHCGASEFVKEMDIVDVWFESGCSWNAVLPPSQQPADLYLEGNDQYRGWFMSSLLNSVALRHAAPYRMVTTPGWTLDEQGRALSKSRGTDISPSEVADQLGAEVIRLWVASVDYREDVVASIPLMKRLAEEIYRKLRNTFKFLLGNLHGFDPAKDSLPFDQLQPLDQYMLAKTRELTEKVLKWYEEFEFNRIFHAINEFCNADLSALYLDVLKDRMYTFAPTSKERLSAQTTLYKITDALVRLVAPILSFTADEVWGYLPKTDDHAASVHLVPFPTSENLANNDSRLFEDWQQLLIVREHVLKNLEGKRKDKLIGKALEAKVVMVATSANLKLLHKYEAALKELLNVSQVELKTSYVDFLSPDQFQVHQAPENGLAFFIENADGIKCERCWNYRTDTAPYSSWPTVCGRCAEALNAMGYAELTASVAQ
jgi:isoleucyl-tRNA synthetase